MKYFKKAYNEPIKTGLDAVREILESIVEYYAYRKKEMGVVILSNFISIQDLYTDCPEKKLLIEIHKDIMSKKLTDSPRIISKLMDGLTKEKRFRMENDLRTFYSFN